MAKKHSNPIKPSRRDDPKPSAETEQQAGATKTEAKNNLIPDPPQPNPLMLVISGVLMVGWMIFLFVVAFR